MAIAKPPIATPFATDPTTQANGDLFAAPSFMEQGYTAPGGNPEIPALGHFNWLFWFAMQSARYHQSRGLPEWDTDEDQYVAPASVLYNGQIWVLVGTATPGTAPSTDLDNWQLWVDTPIAIAGFYARSIWTWRNARRQRRFGISHLGLPDGRFIDIVETWIDVNATTKNSPGSGGWFGKWAYGIFGVDGDISATGSGTESTTLPNGSALTVTCTGGGASAAVVESFKTPLILGANGSIVMAADVGFSGLNVNDSVAFGLGPGTMVSGASTADFETLGPSFAAAFFKPSGDANWWTYVKGAGGSPTIFDTGVVANAKHRLRIEAMGSGVADDSNTRANFYIDGALVNDEDAVDITGTGAPFIRYRAPTAGFNSMIVGALRYQATLWPGDVPVI